MISTLDLSTVTDRLIEVLQQAIDDSPLWKENGGNVDKFTINLSGLMPEAARDKDKGSACELTVYLCHLSAEPYTRNTPVSANGAQPNVRQPLGLALYYLVSAYAKGSSNYEQQAMSIAIKALHERSTYVDPGNGFTFTVTLESEKPDEANRRWQSFSTPFRLSALYRVSVVFLTPKAPSPVQAMAPHRLGLSVGPDALPFATGGALVATASRVDFRPLPAKPGDAITYDFSPAVATPGGSFAVFGSNLSQPSVKRLYLIQSDGSECEVTVWKASAAQNTASRVVLNLPRTVDLPPTSSPPPGVYLLRAGSSIAAGDASDYRSNAVAVTITARIDPVPSPWLPKDGIFSFNGAGFVAGATELLTDTLPLTAVTTGSILNPGEFVVNSMGTNISFHPPASLSAGTYTVRLRVKGTESPPVGRITLP